MNWSDIDFDNPYVKDIGTYEPPSWTVDDNFFKYDPETTGGIDWSTIYANPDVLSGYADESDSNLLKNSLKFVGDYVKGAGSGDGKESQYYDQQKGKDLGLAGDKSWYSHVPGTNVGFYGGGGYGQSLPAIQAAQSLYGAGMASMNPGMQNLGFNDYAKMAAQGLGKQLANKVLYGINPVLGAVNQFYPGGATEAFKDVTRFAGGIGNTISKGVGSVVSGVGDFFEGIFCDERLKVDIAPLESTEVNDELAQMAFFVKSLRECS